MRILRPFAVAAIGATLASLSIIPVASQEKWTPCGGKRSSVTFECATETVPLCHPGVCASSKKIDVHVKRIVEGNAERKAVWVLTGGADASSSELESSLEELYRALDGKASIITMDQRGTGKSSPLECAAIDKQASGAAVDFNAVADCAYKLLGKIDGQPHSFSITSAANDVVYVSTPLVSDSQDIFVYGSGMGSFLAARVMHLSPKSFKGYALDRVVGESTGNFAHTSSNREEAARRLANMCDYDSACRSIYGDDLPDNQTMFDTWRALSAQLDDADNACVDLLCGDCESVAPSDMLRVLLDVGIPIRSSSTRGEIPAVMQQLRRCNDADVNKLRSRLEIPEGKSFYDVWDEVRAERESAEAEPDTPPSQMLTQIIKHSELWSSSNSWDDVKQGIQESTFGVDQTVDYAWHCVLSGNSSDPSCSALKQYGEQLATPMDFSALDSSYKVLYSGDKYYGSFASIPEGAGALVMSSKLDWEFPSSWASDQYEHMTGSNKRLVEFDTNAHGSEFVFSTPEDHNDCAASVLASYVLSYDADLAHVNTSCVEDLPYVEFSG